MPAPGSELVIPVRMDLDKAIGGLKQVGQQAAEPGSGAKEGFQKGQGGVEKFHDSVAGLMKAQMALALIKQAAQAVGEEYKRAGDYVKSMAQEFTVLRHTMQQVAALKGQDNTDKFIVAEATKGASASLLPEEWRKFQEQF